MLDVEEKAELKQKIELAKKSIGKKLFFMEDNEVIDKELTGFNICSINIRYLFAEWDSNIWTTEELPSTKCFLSKQELLDSL